MYNSYLVKLGNGGSASQCGTTTTAPPTTSPSNNQPSPNTIGSLMSTTCSGGGGMNLSGGSGGTFDFFLSMCTGTNVYVGVEGPSVGSINFERKLNPGDAWTPQGGLVVATSAATKANLSSFARQGPPAGLKVQFMATGTYKIYTVSETCYNGLASSSSLVTSCSTAQYSYWTINIVGGGGGPQSSTCTAGAAVSANSDVTLDSSFGTGGLHTFSDSGNPMPNDAVEGPNGTVYVAAAVDSPNSGPSNAKIRIYRFLPSGSLDTSWATAGVLTIDLQNSTSYSEYPNNIVVQSDGSLMVSYSGYLAGMTPSSDVGLIKVTPAGAVDTTYGTNGSVVVDSITGSGNVNGQGLVNGPSGSLYLSVSRYSNSTTTYKIVKVTSAGAVDSSFATSGALTTTSTAFTADASGNLYLPGRTSTSPADAKLTRYTSAGVVDSAFGTNGSVVFDVSPTSTESAGGVGYANGKIYGTITSSVISNGTPTYNLSIFKIGTDGAADSSFGTSGIATLGSTAAYVQDVKIAGDGSIILGGMGMGMSPTFQLLAMSANGTPVSSLITTPATLSAGTCTLSFASVVPASSGLYIVGAWYGGMSSSIGHMYKVAINGAGGGSSNGGGSSAAQAPTLVTSSNAAALVRTPGSQSILVNGQEVVIESNNIEVPAALVPASLRTPAQVAAIQEAGAQLLAAFLASLPAGSSSNVAVVNTATGAIMQNLVFDANGNSVDVPVEDIQFLDGPAISLMIGSNNANITADGKYQIGAGGIIGVTGSGLGSSAPGELVAMSTPTLLGNFTTSAQGDFNKSATLPNTIGVGDHTLVVATGSTYAVMGIRVVPASLPSTGLGKTGSRTVVIALFTMVFAVLLMRSRRVYAI